MMIIIFACVFLADLLNGLECNCISSMCLFLDMACIYYGAMIRRHQNTINFYIIDVFANFKHHVMVINFPDC